MENSSLSITECHLGVRGGGEGEVFVIQPIRNGLVQEQVFNRPRGFNLSTGPLDERVLSGGMDVSNLVPALDPYQLTRVGVAEMSLALSLRRQRFVTGNGTRTRV